MGVRYFLIPLLLVLELLAPRPSHALSDCLMGVFSPTTWVSRRWNLWREGRTVRFRNGTSVDTDYLESQVNIFRSKLAQGETIDPKSITSFEDYVAVVRASSGSGSDALAELTLDRNLTEFLKRATPAELKNLASDLAKFKFSRGLSFPERNLRTVQSIWTLTNGDPTSIGKLLKGGADAVDDVRVQRLSMLQWDGPNILKNLKLLGLDRNKTVMEKARTVGWWSTKRLFDLWSLMGTPPLPANLPIKQLQAFWTRKGVREVFELAEREADPLVFLRTRLKELYPDDQVQDFLVTDKLIRLADVGVGVFALYLLAEHGKERVDAILEKLKFNEHMQESSDKMIEKKRFDGIRAESRDEMMQDLNEAAKEALKKLEKSSAPREFTPEEKKLLEQFYDDLNQEAKSKAKQN